MKKAYDSLKKEINRKGTKRIPKLSSFGPVSHPLIQDLYFKSVAVLESCERIDLISKVACKTYFAFKQSHVSRPINSDLFNGDFTTAFTFFMNILEGRRHEISSAEITSSIYTVAMACCAAKDVSSRGDQKTPGTIFEWLCAAVMEACLNVMPVRSLPVLNLGLDTYLPTDFIFDLGFDKPKFHLPVKTSTRERVIQVWAHQRVLDGVYGSGRFLALPIILTETKADSTKGEVVEICLPLQWRLYQMHIASLWNVCYLDAPASYLELDKKFPRIGVSTLGDVLKKDGRLDELLSYHGLISTQ